MGYINILHGIIRGNHSLADSQPRWQDTRRLRRTRAYFQWPDSRGRTTGGPASLVGNCSPHQSPRRGRLFLAPWRAPRSRRSADAVTTAVSIPRSRTISRCTCGTGMPGGASPPSSAPPGTSQASRAKRKGRDERGPSSGRKSPKDLQARSGRIRSRPAIPFYDAISEEMVNVVAECAWVGMIGCGTGT
jgi:hypothetical protein